MKKRALYILTASLLFVTGVLLPGFSGKRPPEVSVRDKNFNSGWKFIRDSIPGAENPEFNDSRWLTVDLPHDYSIMHLPGEAGPDKIGPFSRKSPGNGNSTGHVIGGEGWYRKSFVTSKKDRDKTVILKFDGVYMESEVWVNGRKAGVHKNGYTPFWFDITSLLNPVGKSNVIAVKVRNNGRNSRWYSGSGIYRNVHLTVVDPVHVPTWGIRITTPRISPESAAVNVDVEIRNNSEKPVRAKLGIVISNKNGKQAGSVSETVLLAARSGKTLTGIIEVQNPLLWSVDTPDLYTAEVTVEAGGRMGDRVSTTFGIRSVEFSAEKGFLLNGKALELKGTCLHHDNGLLGSAAIERAEVRKVELMKAAGFNAIRCSHNPPSEAFLDACDRLGILVIDEFTDMWEWYKNPQDYSVFFREWWGKDLTDMILRDRNHPGIIMWSIGNEILEKSDSSRIRIAEQLAKHVRRLDDTRTVTQAITGVFYPDGWESTAPMFEFTEVCGYNYSPDKFETDHQRYPSRIMYTSESFPKDAYDYWKAVTDHPYVIGDFVWTGMDYIGEVSLGSSSYVPAGQQTGMSGNFSGYKIPRGVNIFDMMANRPSLWPYYVAWCGDLDLTGEKKPQMLYRDVLWDNSKVEINVHAPIPEGFAESLSGWGWPDELPSWNWPGNEGKPMQVRVFTKASMVRLELNGKMVGEKELYGSDKFVAAFEVPYEPGELKAIVLDGGRETGRKVLKTAGEPVALRLTADRSRLKADPSDLSFVKIELVDKDGIVVTHDPVQVRLGVTGNGYLAASGNADPKDMSSVNNTLVNTFRGRAQAVVRPSGRGELKLTAGSPGLKSAELVITALD